jgi:hypothetical protein
VRALPATEDPGHAAVRFALVVLAGCHAPAQPKLEHHAPVTTDEQFLLDAPLFSSDPSEHVLWILERQLDCHRSATHV